MQTLQDNIRIAQIVPAKIHTTNLAGSETPVDCYGVEPEKFDSSLITVAIGAITGAPTGVTVSIVESDASNMAGATTINGGNAVTVSAGLLYTFQVLRTKRYIGVTLTVAGGTTPTVIASATALLTNWSNPLPIV